MIYQRRKRDIIAGKEKVIAVKPEIIIILLK